MNNVFENALKSTLNNETVLTENGACAFATSGKALVDLNFAVSSLRGADQSKIETMFANAFVENPLLATKWLFFSRDVRGGMGERRLFRICFSWLANTRPELVKKLIPLVAEYGRFDDILNAGLEGELYDSVIDYVSEQLKNDTESEHPSLLAKWLPSCNTSSPKTKAQAKKLYNALGMSEKEYRKTLSSLRAKLKVVEVDASANRWSEINYNTVPSMANLKYKNAFLKHDKARRKKYLEDLAKPDSGAKINSSAAFPCDIVNKYTSNGYYRFQKDDALEAMWKALPDYVKGNNDKSTMCVVDTSGSMTAKVSTGNMSALDVALSLGIYFSEHLTGPFKNKFISFSGKPKYIDLSNASSLAEKLDICFKNSEVANTNIKKTFDLILKTAVDNNLKQEDLPSTLLIISDMQFDQGTYQYSYYNADKCALMKEIADNFAEKGYHLPKLVYWNLLTCGRNMTVPMTQNEAGVILLSGFSPALAKMAYSSQIDPYLALVETLNSKRYDVIEQVFKTVEG